MRLPLDAFPGDTVGVMSGAAQAQKASGRPPAARPGRLKLLVLLGCAAGVLALALVLGTGGAGHPRASCPMDGAPEVASVPASTLGALRASVANVLPGRVGRLYEEGAIRTSNAFTDNRPLAPALAPDARRPAGYEMRWWSPNRDVIVADVFAFADAASARRFLERALSTRCRRSAEQAPASRPAQGANLGWVNPDGYAQADIYLTRGTRVYRVAEVPAGTRTTTLVPDSLRRAFYTVDTLACLVPAAGCGASSRAAPA